MKEIFENGDWRRADREQSCTAAHSKRTEWEFIKFLGSKTNKLFLP